MKSQEPPALALPPPSEVGGYRIVRALGMGRRSTVYLGHRDGGEPVMVGVKVLRPEAGNLTTEAAALSEAHSSHVVRLIDASVTPGVTALLLERLTGGGLPSLLLRRRRIAAGETVTLLVAVARGLQALHSAGFAHGAFGQASVLFDDTGRPVIASLGHSVAIDRATSADACADWERFGALVDSALAATQTFGRDGAAADVSAAARALSAHPGEEAVAAFEDAVFTLGPAAPVSLAELADEVSAGQAVGGGDPLASATRQRGRTAAAKPDTPRGGRDAVGTGGRVAAVLRRVAGVGIAALEDGPGAVLRRRLAPLLRRRPVIVAAVAAVALTTGALALLPGGSGKPSTAAVGTAATARPVPRPTQGTPAAGSATAAAESATAGDRGAVLTADDPVGATTLLLQRRSDCIRTAERACLAASEQPGSPLWLADAAPTPATGAAAGGRYAGYLPSLVEREGDAALIALAPPPESPQPAPASALVVKGEAGWRLRQLFEG